MLHPRWADGGFAGTEAEKRTASGFCYTRGGGFVRRLVMMEYSHTLTHTPLTANNVKREVQDPTLFKRCFDK